MTGMEASEALKAAVEIQREALFFVSLAAGALTLLVSFDALMSNAKKEDKNWPPHA